nr:hypothetical protein [Kofleriaceae bacterium]
MLRIAGGVAITLAGLAKLAHADTPRLSPVTTRNYGIELYDGTPIGNSAAIAMGGASVANAAGSSGTLVNASASAVRPTTDTDSWSWDVHFDALDSSLSSDADNNGIAHDVDGGGTAALTVGLALRFGDWAGAVTGSIENTHLDGAVDASGQQLSGETLRVQLAIARWIPRFDLALGGAFDVGEFQLLRADDSQLFAINGTGVDLGATWMPHEESFRFGAQAQTGLRGGNVVASSTSTTCPNPDSCDGYILPSQVVAPAQLAVGAAYRFAPTAWNRQVKAPFRDERAVVVAADLVVTSSTSGSYGLEAFGEHMLQRELEHPAFSGRAGVEWECLPGRLRLRGGTYWEPGVFEGVGGREHATFGIEVRAFEEDVWGPRRGRITLTGDVAEEYRNLSVSVGFWH